MPQIQQQRPEEPQRTWFDRNGGWVIGLVMLGMIVLVSAIVMSTRGG